MDRVLCAATGRVCRRHDGTARLCSLTEAWKDLVRVNKRVNETIKPLTDLEHWGVVERWSYPDDGYGDCEDYVLLKRRMLIQSGWPREALLVTMVRDKKDEGHAVLTVTTDKGDYVLDNQNEHILLWSETGYRFVKRQSQSDPNVWVSLRLGDRGARPRGRPSPRSTRVRTPRTGSPPAAPSSGSRTRSSITRGPSGEVAVFRGVGYGVVHACDAVLAYQVDDELQLVEALEYATSGW